MENPDPDALTTFVPSTDFTGRPFGNGIDMRFKAGMRSSPVPRAWLDTLKDKVADDKPAAEPEPIPHTETEA